MRACVHRDVCSYMYEYLHLFVLCFQKKKLKRTAGVS
jgi:hypothetical protein